MLCLFHGKQDDRKLNTEAQQELKRVAIRLKKSGKTYAEISEIIQVHKSTICAWYKKYEREGHHALKIRKRGRPTGFMPEFEGSPSKGKVRFMIYKDRMNAQTKNMPMK